MPYLDPQEVYDRQEARLHDEWERGRITDAELREELKELQREFRAMAEEAAMDAYNREFERW